jgi:L-gulonate 3-dehydrogenase
VFEDVQLKKQVFSEIDANITNDEMTVGSSTSCFLPSLFTSGLKHQANFLVAHPINPPYFIPLVELVPAPWTDPKAVQKVRTLMEEIGQSPVTMSKELPGFAVNRIQYAILNECFNLVNEQVLTAEDVDKVMRDGLGLR